MALIIAFVNKSKLADMSNYEVDVYVNERHIAGPFIVKGHKRDNGWFELLKKFVDDHTTIE
jgi:hypothetical protein